MKNAKLTFGTWIWAILLLAGCHELGHYEGDRGDRGGRVGRLERFEGTVTIVDRGHAAFEIGTRNSERFTFLVVPNTRNSARDRFGSLKVGDFVRVEAYRRDQSNYELEDFR